MKKALVLALIFVLILLNTAAFAEYDPVVVQVGALGYTRSQVMEAISLAEESYVQQGGTVSSDIKEKLRKDTVDYFVCQGILENKINELNLATPDKEEKDQIEKDVRDQWEKALTKAKEEMITLYHVDPEKADAYAEMYLDISGITLDELRLELNALWKQNRITEYVVKDVPRLTDAEVEDWYNQNLVLPGKTAYANDIAAFETDVMLNGATIYYVPAEYRFVQNIVFYAPQEKREECQLKALDLLEAQDELERAENALYGCQVLGEDATEAEAAVTEAQARADALKREIDEMKKNMSRDFLLELDDIERRLEAGEDFAVLQNEYDQNTDRPEKGYMVCEESLIWERAFKEAAMEMKEPGDFIGPVYTASGPQFLYYAEDVPQGAVPLDEDSMKVIRKLAQADADSKLLMSFIDQWKDSYHIVTREELLKLS